MRNFRGIFIWVGTIFFLSINGLASFDSEMMTKTFLSAKGCQNTIAFDSQNLYLGFGSYRKFGDKKRRPRPGKVDIYPMLNGESRFDNDTRFDEGSPLELRTSDGVVDLATDEENLYVLTFSSVEVWSKKDWSFRVSYPTQDEKRELLYREHPRGIALFDDKIWIAHGRLGVRVLDKKTGAIDAIEIWPDQWPHESQAMDLVKKDRTIWVAADNFTLPRRGEKPAFRGLISIDAQSKSVIRRIGGVSPGLTAIDQVAGGLVLHFHPLHWFISDKNLSKKRLSVDKRFQRSLDLGWGVQKPLFKGENAYFCWKNKQNGRYRRFPAVFKASDFTSK